MIACFAIAFALMLAPWQRFPLWLVYCSYVATLALVVVSLVSFYWTRCPKCAALLPFNLPLRNYPGTRAINNCPYCGLSFDSAEQS